MRAIWKGSISFSLVNIPISLYPATRRKELTFHLLRRSDLSPIKYNRVAEMDNREVPWEEIVKGYEYEKDQYIVLTEEDFKRADIKATQSIDILEFVSLDEIDPIFFDKPYYLEPDKKGAKAYGLLREALQRANKVGLAKVVIKTRQHLAAVKPEDHALVLELMHFAEELVNPGELQIPGKIEVGPRELDMAAELIKRMSGHWQPEKYTDDYRHALLELIDEKVKRGGQTPAGAPAPKGRPAKVIDLVSVLQESLGQTGKGGAGKAQKRKKKALKTAA